MVLHWTEPERLGDDWHQGLLGEGALFELADADVLGAKLPVFTQRPLSLVDVLRRTAEAKDDRAFLGDADRVVTFGQAPRVVGTVARHLVDEHGVTKGDVVGLAGEVTLEHCLAIWALASLGATVATMNPSWTRSELGHALTLTSPSLLITDREVGTRLPTDVTSISFDALAIDDIDDIDEARLPDAGIDEDDPFAIVFTSGTTGRPKGATLSHRNAIHFSLAAAATTAVHNIVHALPSSGRTPTVIASAPLFHMSGLLGQLTNAAFWGMTVVIPPAGRWDATTHLSLTEQHRVTTWSVVPTQLWRLIEHPDLANFDLSSLDTIGGGGSTFSPELLRRTAACLPHVSTALRVGYGMTETAGTVTLLQPPYDEAHRASVGTPVAGTEISVRSADGYELPDGEIGEIRARSAQVFLGYWNDPAATAAVVDQARWYATGDYGRISDGHLYLESRLRDLIIRGGENIYPIEIENRLSEHRSVVEAAVVGVDHPTLGQEVKAVVVRRPGTEVDAAELRAWVAITLTRHKVPAQVEFVDELPRNATGKVVKEQLT
jgi:acyl-CoA synthetase (AMP-forming)/AMP-acid ligase II